MTDVNLIRCLTADGCGHLLSPNKLVHPHHTGQFSLTALQTGFLLTTKLYLTSEFELGQWDKCVVSLSVHCHLFPLRRKPRSCDQKGLWKMTWALCFSSSVSTLLSKHWAQDTRIWLVTERAAESCYLLRTHWLVGLIKSQRKSGGVVQLCNQRSSVLWIEKGMRKWTKQCSEWKCLP